MGPYRVMVTPEDLLSTCQEFIVEDELPVPDLPEFKSQFEDYSHDEKFRNDRIRINYKDYMREICRPFVLEVAKDYTGIKLNDVLNVMFDSLAYVASYHRIGMMNYYQSADESELNNIDKFQQFMLNMFITGNESQVPLEFEGDPVHEPIFFNTFSQVSRKVFEQMSQDA